MNSSYFRGRVIMLWGVLFVAMAYIGWLFIQHSFTHHARIEGWIGVLGGLYVCSHPAASFIDQLFFGQHEIENRLNASEWFTWIALNLIVFILGCLMISVGVIHFIY